MISHHLSHRAKLAATTWRPHPLPAQSSKTYHELSVTNASTVRFPTFNFYTYANLQKLASYSTPAEAQSLPNLRDEESVVVMVQGLWHLTELAHTNCTHCIPLHLQMVGTLSIGTNKYTFKTDWLITYYHATKGGHNKYHIKPFNCQVIHRIMKV
jgi:hypothetical protein